MEASRPPGDPVSHRERIARGIHEMLGLARGVIADGVVNDAEARALREWAESHPEVVGCWPGNILARRLRRIFQDGHVDDDERLDLAALLERIVAGSSPDELPIHSSPPISFDDPPPVIRFRDQAFVFVGRFAYGPMGACHRAVLRLGGSVEGAVTARTRYVVVGSFGSGGGTDPAWTDRLEAAARIRDGGGNVCIVSEEHWAAALP